jgi:hypothetical protein
LVAQAGNQAVKAESSCSLREIDNKEKLAEKNLILTDIKCRNVTSNSEQCLSYDSFVTYKCRPGFIFQNNQGYLVKKLFIIIIL